MINIDAKHIHGWKKTYGNPPSNVRFYVLHPGHCAMQVKRLQLETHSKG